MDDKHQMTLISWLTTRLMINKRVRISISSGSQWRMWIYSSLLVLRPLPFLCSDSHHIYHWMSLSYFLGHSISAHKTDNGFSPPLTGGRRRGANPSSYIKFDNKNTSRITLPTVMKENCNWLPSPHLHLSIPPTYIEYWALLGLFATQTVGKQRNRLPSKHQVKVLRHLPLPLDALEHLQLLPAIVRLDPSLSRRSPVLGDKGHPG